MMERIQALISDVIGRFFMSSRQFMDIIISMLIALIIGWVISQVYKKTHRGMNHELTFMSSLVILAPTVTLVMLFIRGDLIVSLGLIGSLSIIRFRSAIKDTRDMIFLFWSIVVGLGVGTYNWPTVVVGSIILMAAIFILYLVKYGKSQNLDYILIITGESETSYEQIAQVVDPYVENSQVRSQEVQEGGSELVLELSFASPNPVEFERMIQQLYALSFVKNVSLLSPQLSLPV